MSRGDTIRSIGLPIGLPIDRLRHAFKPATAKEIVTR